MDKSSSENDKIIVCPKCEKSNSLSFIKLNNHASHTGELYCPNCFCELDINILTGSAEKEIKKIKSSQKKAPSHCPHCGRYISRSSVANVKDPICQSCGNYVLKKYNRKVKDLEFAICPYCSIHLTIPYELINAETLRCNNCHNDFRNPYTNINQENKLNYNDSKLLNNSTSNKGTYLLLFGPLIAIGLIMLILNVFSTSQNTKSYVSNSNQNLIRNLNSKYIGKKYNMEIADELYEKYGAPETLNGTNNYVWIAYYPKGNFTMTESKGDYIIIGFEYGRNPRE